MRQRWMIWLAVLALGLGACADEPEEEPEPDITEEPAPDDTTGDIEEPDEGDADTAAATVSTADLDVGEVLVDGEGMSLYVFDNDEGGESTCYDDCATTWPPLVATGDPVADGAADEALLGTTERDDGTTQVTYDGRPLYYYAADSEPGDLSGQGVGGVWWAVAPEGEAIEDE